MAREILQVRLPSGAICPDPVQRRSDSLDHDRLAAVGDKFRALAELAEHIYLPRSKLNRLISCSRSPSWPTSGLTPIMSACSRAEMNANALPTARGERKWGGFRANADACERFDVDAVSRRGCGIVGLDQLWIERILGAR
jgi:hypothetical protein